MLVLSGTDIATVFADGKIVHDGNLVVSDPLGDVIVSFGGTSEAEESAYDEFLEGHFPARFPCLLNVRLVSTNPGWAAVTRTPLIGAGMFEGATGTLDFTLMAIDEY